MSEPLDKALQRFSVTIPSQAERVLNIMPDVKALLDEKDRRIAELEGELEGFEEIEKERERVAMLLIEEENKRLRKALTGAIVNYDTCPYQMATEEIERLEQTRVVVTLNGKTGDFWYLLDAQAVEDIAKPAWGDER